eukprot:4987-Heterococcus_DN1.PRE.3
MKLCDFIAAVHTTIEHTNSKPLSITTKQKLATHIVAFYNICKDTGATPLIHDDITQSEKVSSHDLNSDLTQKAATTVSCRNACTQALTLAAPCSKCNADSRLHNNHSIPCITAVAGVV